MKKFSAACERNQDPILDVLQRVLPPAGLVLEIASGTGQHAVHFARELPALQWQPTDPSREARASIQAWAEEASLANVSLPLELDVREVPWPIERADAVVNCNMIHISPWEAGLALFEGAGRVLSTGAPLYLYGPFFIAGQPAAPSNLDFDAYLKSQNHRWGVRDLGAVAAAAKAQGLELEEVVPMPANNFSVIMRRV